MNAFLNLIEKHATGFIVVCGLVIAALLLVNGIILSNKKSRLEETLVAKDTKYFKDAINKEISMEKDENSGAKPDTIRALETDFNTACSWHDVLVQFIPIFPLLGILGTVAGLMLEVNAGDIAAMLSSLDTALVTTFWGLIFAIVLKVIEAVFPSRIISSVEVMLDDFDKRINISDMFQGIQNEKQ